MSLYSPFTYFKETARLLFQKRVKDGQLAFLGDSDGTGARVEVPDAPGYVYARFQNVPDANGNATFSAPFLVRSGNAAFQNYPGASVYVAVGYNGELEIVSANYQELTRNGIDTRTLNPLHQQSKWVYLFQLTIGLCSAVANSVNGSFLVTVKKYRHYVNNIFQTFETGAQADKIDLAPYIPAVDMHCYAAVWVDTYTNTAHVTTSTAQSLFTTLDDTDIQECVADRPPDGIPHKLFYLSNNQGTVTQQAAKDVDVRQFLNTPAVHGFPNPVAYRERIHPDRQVLFAGSLVVTGSLEVLGSLIGVPTVSGSGSGSSGAPADATYIVQTANSTLTNEQALGALTTGILKSTTTTGVVSIAAAGTDYTSPTGTENLSNKTFIDGVVIDGSADEIQLRVQANGTQTNPLFLLEDSGGNTQMLVYADGETEFNFEGNDVDFKIKADTNNLGFVFNGSNTGALGIGDFPDASAALDVDSTTKGFLAPRQTTVQRDAISSPATGLQVYNTTTKRLEYYNGTVWMPVMGAIAILWDAKAANTAGGTSSSTTWNNRDLNTEHYDPDGIVSISSNKFTPVAGDYELWCYSPYVGGTAALSRGRNRLFNVTGGTAVQQGMTNFAALGNGGIAPLSCKFTANGTDEYRIDTYTSVGRATDGLGFAVNDGSSEIYTVVVLRKIA